MRKTWSLLVAVGVVVAFAVPAQAGTFDAANSTLTFQLGGLPKLTITAVGGPGGNPGASTVTLTDDGSGGHVLSDGSSVWTTIDFSPGTSFFTGVPLISDLRVTMDNNAGGFISGLAFANPVGPGTIGPGLGGLEQISGSAVVSAISGLVMQPVPLTRLGFGGQFQTSLPGSLPITVTGAPFHTGWATITSISTNIITIPDRGGVQGNAFTLMPTPNEDTNTVSTGMGVVETGGGAAVSTTMVTIHGTNSLLSGSKAGQVTLVSPFRVITPPTLAGKIPGQMIKKFVFVPEPGALVLLLAGAAGLVAVGRKRMR
ncbi:MAG: PEP-CTERM sorting domain-containing protein [Vicinamibacterales bacterium]|nr:PEP-CTERM sorting domain-containing protein [Vicinamibacterales bacterium]